MSSECTEGIYRKLVVLAVLSLSPSTCTTQSVALNITKDVYTIGNGIEEGEEEEEQKENEEGWRKRREEEK